ncbi:hypothetical protein IT408_02735 [Candidatus Uhrbacteria bacterium]|nr:hypothetical protein [Candidatus Uhrbacteria bacterium]
MTENLEQALRRLQQLPAPNALLESILLTIAQQKELRLFKRHVTLCSLAFFSFISLTVAFHDILREEMTTSAFISYLSLAYQDTDIFISHWQNAILSFLDALPIYSLLAGLFLSGFIALIFHFSVLHYSFVQKHRSRSKPATSFF